MNRTWRTQSATLWFLAEWRVEKRDCSKMQDGDHIHPRREATGAINSDDEVFEFLLGGTEHERGFPDYGPGDEPTNAPARSLQGRPSTE